MNVTIALVFGLVLGVMLTGVLVVWLMRTRMMVPRRSGRSFEETCAAIEAVVPKHEGWGFPRAPFDMHAKLSEKGKHPAGITKIRQYAVCKPALAQRVLGASPFISAMMPCTWSVYELDDGSVWLSKMNVGLMSKVFPGVVRSAMGEVAATEQRMMAEVLAMASSTKHEIDRGSTRGRRKASATG
jgi:uncharacterized protein (DUF302 family)